MNDILKEGSDEFRELHRKISNLEQHLINLVVPIQGISKLFRSSDLAERLVETFSKPIQIDDRALKKYLDEFYEKMLKFAVDRDLSQAFAEIKYIGNRLNKIEETLCKIQSAGIKKTLDVALSVDGYEMVKKPKNYEECPIEDPNKDLEDLLDTLHEKEKIAVIHRLGLKGEKPKTYEAVGDVLNLTKERARQLYSKGIRKMRDPKRRNLLVKVKNDKLRKEVGS